MTIGVMESNQYLFKAINPYLSRVSTTLIILDYRINEPKSKWWEAELNRRHEDFQGFNFKFLLSE